jgi:hypothetical protein
MGLIVFTYHKPFLLVSDHLAAMPKFLNEYVMAFGYTDNGETLCKESISAYGV